MAKSIVTFGEIMVRLMPPQYLRFSQATNFEVNFTGAEANTAVSLSIMGENVEFVTRLPNNDIAECALAMMRKHNVGTTHVKFGDGRLGLYYLERGASQRPSKIVYDREHTAISRAKLDDFDWDHIFAKARLFYFSGITPGLSEASASVCLKACQMAKNKGISIACDLNYRRALWTPEQARNTMEQFLPYIDILVCNEEDAACVLGIKAKGSDITGGKIDYKSYEDVARQIVDKYGKKDVAFTLRTSITASDNRWAGMLYKDGKAYFSRTYDIHLVDRVGGGDSFDAGLLYTYMHGFKGQEAIEYAVAASCLKHTIEKDFNLATVEEVRKLMEGDGSGRIVR